ncbi:Pre-mRNA splicing factor [Mycena venus]|uniref:Pre-mRNA splicing factor n=1 Tax=Mycena venus TaxID=2733690 RepID=A0A8H7CLP5_9AGAR|nr:Pre-mRNA splicing factor [Mycena venus]
MESDEERDESFSQATYLVEKVFNEVYEEFRVWKNDYASRTLLTVARPPSPNDNVSDPATSDLLPSEGSQISPPPSPTLEYMEMWDSETGTTQRVSVEVYDIVDAFPAVTEHEHCTPAVRNIFHGDDPDYLPFMPFADDPTFDHARYLEAYKGVSWQTPGVDPDLEVVIVETARRLHGEHQMLYQHIDETGVLPLELLDRDGARGMIYRSRRRDFPDWPPGVSDSEKRLKPDPTDTNSNSPDKLLAIMVSDFCTNLNCNVSFCSTHHDPTPMPLTTVPLVKSQRLKSLAGTSCGVDCFLVKSLGIEDSMQWSDDDIQLVRTILDFGPDTVPCDLAKMCGKPCYEVLEQRRIILPDIAISKTKPKAKTKPKVTRNTSSLFADFDASKFTPGRPCRHDGPCDATTQCPCFLIKAHCESACRCSRKCTRRWQGCACSVTKRDVICRTPRCACYLAHRECDPEICKKCQAKCALILLQFILFLVACLRVTHLVFCRDAEANICQNADIQRARWKRTKVAPARWGKGLFMAEDAALDDLIIEYVGEIIYDPTTDSREPIAEHRQRNYLFELNETLSIDGAYVGNDARYINHDAQNFNCYPKVRMVNGEHRIGIYAKRPLHAGEEVLFNYGIHFFQSKNEDSEGAGPSK